MILIVGITSFGANAQQIQFLDLPSLFEREFEISGLTGNEDNLFLAAERCAKIFVVNKEDMTHVETIHLDMKDLPNGIEIEGLSLYKNFLLLTDEKNGKVFSFNLSTRKLRNLESIGLDLSSFKGKYGIEGIAVDGESNLLYLLREKNEKFQSEIHSFSIYEKEGLIDLKYRNQTLIQHKNEKWRYTGLSIDSENNRLLCLKSYYVKNLPKLSKRSIDYLLFDSLTSKITSPNNLLSLTKEMYFMRNSFALNIEGIYSDDTSIYITSDNGEGSKDCNQKSSKTMMMKIKK